MAFVGTTPARLLIPDIVNRLRYRESSADGRYLADAILVDRLVHNAYRLELRGDSLRRPEAAGDAPTAHQWRPAGSPPSSPAAQAAQDAR